MALTNGKKVLMLKSYLFLSLVNALIPINHKWCSVLCLFLFYCPDWGEASLDGRLQRHQLCVSGEPALRPDLLCCGFLRPVGPHGPGLPADLRHCHEPRATDRDAAARRLGPHQRDGPGHHREVLHVLGPLRALPSSDNNGVLLFGARSHSEQPHARWDQGGKDPGNHNGLFLLMLGAVLHHQRGGPLHSLLSALAAVDSLAVARVHQLRIEPVPVRLPEPGVPEGVPGDPLLRGRAVRAAGKLLLQTNP